jgi:hypothetical protein
VPLSAGERRRLAGLEAGDLPVFAGGTTDDAGADELGFGVADTNLDAAARTMRELAAQVHGLLRERRTG